MNDIGKAIALSVMWISMVWLVKDILTDNLILGWLFLLPGIATVDAMRN